MKDASLLGKLPIVLALAMIAVRSSAAIFVPPQEESFPVKVRPSRDPERFGFLSRDALREERYADALELVLQANAVDPRPENTLTQAQALVGLGRIAEAYGLFERTIDLSGESERRYDLEPLVAYGDAARKLGRDETAKTVYALALERIAEQRERSTPDGIVTPIDPKTSRDAGWIQAASLTIGLFTKRTAPGSPAAPKTTDEKLARLREIDRLAPNWDRVWSVLLFRVDTSHPQMTSFATAKINRLCNSRDPELSRSMRFIKMSELLD